MSSLHSFTALVVFAEIYLLLIQQPNCCVHTQHWKSVKSVLSAHTHKWDTVRKRENCASFNYRHPPFEPIIGAPPPPPPSNSFKLEHTRSFPTHMPLPHSAIDVAMETVSPSTLRWSLSASAHWFVIGKQRLVLMGRGVLHSPQAACWSMQPGHQVERVLEDLWLVLHLWLSATGGGGDAATQAPRWGGLCLQWRCWVKCPCS